MKKKNFKTFAIVGVIAGCVLIGTVSAFAASVGNPYEDFKAAALQTTTETNMTVTADVTAKQDGAALLSGTMVSQQNGENSYSSTKMQVNGQTVDREESSTAGATIMRNGDTYTSITRDSARVEKQDKTMASPNTQKLMSMVADLLVGNTKTHFTSSGDTVTVNLDGAQVPELLNVAVAAGMERTGSKPDMPMMNGNNPMGTVLQNLAITQNAKVDSIHMTAGLANGALSAVDCTVVLSGQDSSGGSHEIDVTVNAKITDIGATTPAAVDTTGKTVTQDQMPGRGMGMGKGMPMDMGK